ncbi:MAG: 30S ribosomal protein S21 [Candidatus Portnoybacteria bacterium]|jgi:ribosomal protein S21|nr:30S ribosomal protein S21 [Candidatus Portnoybacteria bacterium]
MAVEVRRKEREPVGSLLRRFTRRVQQSRVLLAARKGRFHNKKKTKRQVRLSALRREQLRALRKDMMKAGLLEEGQLIPKEKIKINK